MKNLRTALSRTLQLRQLRFEVSNKGQGRQGYMGGCPNYGPFSDPYHSTAPNIEGTQKGTIILTTTHIRAAMATTNVVLRIQKFSTRAARALRFKVCLNPKPVKYVTFPEISTAVWRATDIHDVIMINHDFSGYGGHLLYLQILQKEIPNVRAHI